MKQRGIPTVVQDGNTSTLTEGVGALIALPETPEVSLSLLLGGALANTAAAIEVLIDIPGRRFVMAPQSSENSAFQDGIAALPASGYSKSVFAPEEGQEGRSVTWDDPTNTGATRPAWLIAIAERLAPVRPKFTAESFLSMVAAEIPADFDGKVFVYVDQNAGTISVVTFPAATAIPANVTAVFEDTESDIVSIELADPVVDGAPTPLKFEGAAF